jgi:ATP-dependent exoDNAse (exonuclease V) beta subunit
VTRPVDHTARERARREHGVSFVLEAGAGTGKTTLLVDRIESLVRSGAARLDEIAAVTFTENAATTMKLRLRERLEAARARSDVPEMERSHAGAALEVLERAPISTIHALCAAMLQERPIQCGVVPGFRVADEAETDLLFGAAWGEWLDERLVAGDDDLLAALDEDIPLEGVGPYGERSSLRGLARTLLEQRDLEPLVAEGAVDPSAWRTELEAKARRAAELIETVPAADALAARLQALGVFAEQARFLKGPALVRHLRKLAVIPRNFGHRPRWPSDEALEEARGIAEWTKTAGAAWSAAASAALHGRLVRALLGVVERYQQKKRAAGVLDFLDLLLFARDALRDRESVRRYFRERFRFLIIDEFQDTDPLQVEIARLLVGDAPGGLTVVGDAKQSIYRFRRAEVALFRRLSEEAQRRPGHAVLHLTQNFRSRPAILRFVNRVFAGLIQASEAADQPAYEPIDPPPGLPEEPSVVALAFDAPFAEGDDLLEHEATALAAFVSEAAAGGFEVRDPSTGVVRPSRAGDVMVLSRRLTQLRSLEEALEAAGLRFAVDGGKSFFDRQEVHEVLAVLRAVEDPSDRVSLVAALRSSFFGVSDRDIVSYHLAGGYLRLGPVDEQRPGAAALAPAIDLLTELHGRRTEASVAALLDRLYERTRILAALTGTRRGEAQVANLEKVATLARQAGELGVLTLRGFTRLLEERIATAREEPDLPVTRPGDPSTVRLLSIHKAKGLESPIVALYDTADNFRIAAETIPLWDQGKIAIGFREGCQPPGWDELRKRDDAKNWAEARRLLYVACTRARDLLVVPRPSADARVGAFWRDLIAALPAASDADARVIDAATLRVSPAEPLRIDLKALAAAEGGDAVAARWDAERKALLAEAGRRPFVPVPATRVAGRTAPPAALGLGGGGGRDFGSLVHRILQWIPLDESRPDAVHPLAAALAPVHGVDQAGVHRAADAVLRVLGLPLLDRARRASRLWRELPIWLPEGDELVEGIVDLVFEEDGQLVVADYKTDPIQDDQAIAQAAHHAAQLQLYGRGLALATGLKVRERLVVFTALGRAVPV